VKIAPPGDDAHLLPLRSRNESGAPIPVAEGVEPVARAEDLPAPATSRQQERPAVDRRSGVDRRKGDRRQRAEDVMLDTRDSRERRRMIRRREDRERLASGAAETAAGQPDEPAEETPRRGIDLYV